MVIFLCDHLRKTCNKKLDLFLRSLDTFYHTVLYGEVFFAFFTLFGNKLFPFQLQC